MSAINFGYLRSLIPVALLVVLCGCKPQMEAPSPSNSGTLTEGELNQLKESSDRGDNEATYRLAIYYLFHEQDDKQGWSWMEKSADAGNPDARKVLLDYFAERGSPEQKARSEMLKRKWASADAKSGGK